jgi:NifU-like protein involved in Fe-S cluster formation
MAENSPGLCCSASRRLTVGELFERGLRRNRERELSIEGTAIQSADGMCARFSLDVVDGHVAEVGFRVTTCTALIAYSEYIAELTPGLRLEAAREFSPTKLVEVLPDVPAFRHDRAVLAIAAFRSVLLAAESDPCMTDPSL